MFDAQPNNDLDCVLHYTTRAPWLGGARTPSQVLFERFAEEAALPVNRQSSEFKRSVRRNFWRNALAPLRALAFPIGSFLYGIAGKKEKSAAYKKVARYWLDYIRIRRLAAAPSAPSGNHQNEIRLRTSRCFMVLHLNTHSSGGSHGCAVLLSTALAERGLKARCSQDSQQLQSSKPFLDRVIRKRMSRFQLNRGMGRGDFVTTALRSCKVRSGASTRLQIGSMFSVGWDTTNRDRWSLLCVCGISRAAVSFIAGAIVSARPARRVRSEDAFESRSGKGRAAPKITGLSEPARSICCQQPMVGGSGRS